MPVLVIGEADITEEIYGAMIGQLTPVIKASKGFIAHVGGPSPSGAWRVIEVWETEEDAQNWFDTNVKPKLPPGVTPDRQHYPLHTAVTK